MTASLSAAAGVCECAVVSADARTRRCGSTHLQQAFEDDDGFGDDAVGAIREQTHQRRNAALGDGRNARRATTCAVSLLSATNAAHTARHRRTDRLYCGAHKALVVRLDVRLKLAQQFGNVCFVDEKRQNLSHADGEQRRNERRVCAPRASPTHSQRRRWRRQRTRSDAVAADRDATRRSRRSSSTQATAQASQNRRQRQRAAEKETRRTWCSRLPLTMRQIALPTSRRSICGAQAT